ncbi:MAG: helix-turn-helix domain-containing protein [Bifidobacteriaceae bacterium]|jgi:excisionase family DNA binding protein|nr:helix-turn-helix domain-containing protein [Bifidobacteriaceae bacterium]
MPTLQRTYPPTHLDDDLVTALERPSDHAVTQPTYELTVFTYRNGHRHPTVRQLPSELVDILRQAAEALHEGLAVTVKPESRQLTTTQVADLLGVTRPTVVKLIDSGAIPSIRVGTHRRVALPDALAYREARRNAQYDFIAATAVQEEEPVQVVTDLKRIRRQVAEERHSSRV